MGRFLSLNKLIKLALKEDIGSGDITTNAIIKKDSYGRAFIIAKQGGVLCGIDVVRDVFYAIDKKINVKPLFNDGDRLKKGNKVVEISGNIATILKGERVALNFLSHLSGIATYTNSFVKLLGKNSKVKILDTRKTIPLLRNLEKHAVRVGGGQNHRMGLYDMILIKENHIEAAGGIGSAILLCRAKYGDKYIIEVETKNIKEVKEAIKYKADIIMLDNMNINTIKQAIEIIRDSDVEIKIEVSGNVDEESIKRLRGLDIDYISIGRITHSAPAFDFSLIIS